MACGSRCRRIPAADARYLPCRSRAALGSAARGDERPKAIRKRHEITMNKIEDRRSRAAHVNVRVLLPIPDRFDVQKLPFDAVEASRPNGGMSPPLRRFAC